MTYKAEEKVFKAEEISSMVLIKMKETAQVRCVCVLVEWCRMCAIVGVCEVLSSQFKHTHAQPLLLTQHTQNIHTHVHTQHIHAGLPGC